MVLIDLTVTVIALLITVPAMGLYAIGTLLNRIADNIDDFSQNVRTIAGHTQLIRQSVAHLNQTGKLLAAELPLLYNGAERLVAEATASATTPPYSIKIPIIPGEFAASNFPSHTRATWRY